MVLFIQSFPNFSRLGLFVGRVGLQLEGIPLAFLCAPDCSVDARCLVARMALPHSDAQDAIVFFCCWRECTAAVLWNTTFSPVQHCGSGIKVSCLHEVQLSTCCLPLLRICYAIGIFDLSGWYCPMDAVEQTETVTQKPVLESWPRNTRPNLRLPLPRVSFVG